ncbi:MAG TPA: response regulator transcription factor [Acidobacteriaceae bacterium]|jgi:DNA-binding response OmpR family regulator|nr:response regulator transcription factor [Acidobacteriaceae bacterium]
MNLPANPHHRVLVVEDEAHLAQGLLFNLQAEGYETVIAGDGEAALQLLLTDKTHFDAILLDVMLPGQDGFSVAAALRSAQNYTPVLMLTARGRPEDVLEGFAAGADDYLAKPFDLSILLARLHGLLRRMRWTPAQTQNKPAVPATPDVYSFSDKTIDFSLLELRTATKHIQLTLMEAELLRHLIQNPGRAIARKEILEQVWHLHEDTDTRAIDNFIVRLRRYLEDDPSQPVHLQTVRGVGYRFLPNGESSQ